MNPLLIAVAVVFVLGIVAFATHLLLSLFARRGWIYYRSPNRPRPRPLGILEEIYQPSITHTTAEETRLATEADQSESGDPDEPGTQTRERETGAPQ